MTEPGHKYTKDPKFKHAKNVRPVRVGRRVFNSLTAAETFCEAHDLDVNHAIEWEDTPEFKAEAIETAKIQKAILRGLKERLQQHLNMLDIQHKRAHQEYEDSLKTCDLLSGHKETVFHELGAKCQECYTGIEILTAMLFELEDITG